MADKIPLTLAELQDHLAEQRSFLEASCDAYDAGFTGEAKRIATVIRILVHDTKNSKSLLNQLNLKSYFFDTAPPMDSENFISESPLIFMTLPGETYLPKLDSGPPSFNRWRPFIGWWRDPIFKDRNGRTLSREDLILTASNQDGGAHVDPALNAVYADLAKDNSLGWMVDDVEGSLSWATEGQKDRKPIKNPHKAAIRQIGHEMLKMLIRGYSKANDPMIGQAISVHSMTATLNPKSQKPTIFKFEHALINPKHKR